jgi:hypothetical protein
MTALETITPCRPGEAHRWALETPNGQEVRGECRRCGAVRQFRTTIEDRAAWTVLRLRGSLKAEWS